jgi:hypothetical protein
MILHRLQTGFRLGVALATLMLLFGAIAPTARLWVPEPVTCGMACCEKSGVCYCRQHHHTGESDTTGEAARAAAHLSRLDEVSVGSSCPTRCAQLPAGFQKQSIARTQQPRLAFVAGSTCRPFIHIPYWARDALVVEAHAPRAPPITLL